jgi:peptidoglycan/LPS O-acetylase OafA/YrhL
VAIDSDKLLFAFCYSLASWCWILGLVGAGMKFFDKENATRRYVADASYWVYIAHIPVLFFLQTAFMEVPLHWAIKFPLILAIATPILFWTYDKWVRYTFIGNVLNGPRQRPEQQAGAAVTN